MGKRFTLSGTLTHRASRRALRPALLFAVLVAAIVAPFVAARGGAQVGGSASGQELPFGVRVAVRNHAVARKHGGPPKHASRRKHAGRRKHTGLRKHAGSRKHPGAGKPVPAAVPAPLEGVFENCPLDTAMSLCTQRLAVMQASGLRVVVFPEWGGSLPSLATYAAAAHALGISVMWEIGTPSWWRDPATSTSAAASFRGFANACGCSQNAQLLAYLVSWLGAMPGTYGYYAADDSQLSVGDQAGMAAYVSQIKQSDPGHTVMIGSYGLVQAQEYVNIADMVGNEMYPVTTNPLLPVSANESTWDTVANTAGLLQTYADDAHRQSAFILQAFTWGDNLADGRAIGVCSPGESNWDCYAQLRYPSPGEQLQLRDEILLNAHPSLILWYSFFGTYGQAGTDTNSIYPTGAEAAARWAGLSGVIQAPIPPLPSQGAGAKH